jgi:predicted nucleotide-binding protein
MRVSISNRTIATLASPFQHGNGPSHSTIDLVWTEADASEYLGEGNKLDRVLGGLRALRDGRAPRDGQPPLTPDPEKLVAVASNLASRLVALGLVNSDAVREALGTEEDPEEPPREASGASITTAIPKGTEAAELTISAGEPLVEDPTNVMVVHGQDSFATRALFDWLRAIGLKPREWGQLVNSAGEASPFIGRVLERAFAEAQAVVVLFTPDEHVRLREPLSTEPSGWRLQSRPNVLFEAGMAFATHPTRSVLVVLGPQDLPSDLAGRHYVRVRSSADLQDLARRLQSAGCPVDLSGSDWLDVGRFPDRSAIIAAASDPPTSATG